VQSDTMLTVDKMHTGKTKKKKLRADAEYRSISATLNNKAEKSRKEGFTCPNRSE